MITHEHGRGKATGREWKTPVVDRFEIRDGKVHHLLCVYDTAAVERAFTGADRAPLRAGWQSGGL